MRITQSMVTRNLMTSINRNRENMHSLQNSIVSGKEVETSSKDPVSFARASRFRNTISQNEQFLRNITDALGWTATTSAIVEDVNSLMHDVQEIATQGADDTNDSDSRDILAERMDSLLEEITTMFNGKYLGKTMFSGTLTDDEPFVYDGTSVTYQGNSENINRRISENLNISISLTGEQVMNTNIFTAMIELKDALSANDTDAINNALGSVNSSVEQYQAMTTAYGSIQNQLTLTQQRLEMANVNLASYLSQTEDMDLSEAITMYNNEELAYQAALQTTSDAINLNILNFIR